MPGRKSTSASAAGISTTFEHKDVRSDAVPSLRHKSRRKRYQHANAELIGTVRDHRESVNEFQRVWNERNIFQMKTPAYTPRLPHRKGHSKPAAAVGTRTGWVSEEISRVLYETDDDDYTHSPFPNDPTLYSHSVYDIMSIDPSSRELFQPIAGSSEGAVTALEEVGFESRGVLVWDAAWRRAEDKWADGVVKREWEVVGGGEEEDEWFGGKRGGVGEEDEGFELL